MLPLLFVVLGLAATCFVSTTVLRARCRHQWTCELCRRGRGGFLQTHDRCELCGGPVPAVSQLDLFADSEQGAVQRRPRVERRFATGYPTQYAQCGHPSAVEVCHGDAKRVMCTVCGEWLVEFGVHRDGVIIR